MRKGICFALGAVFLFPFGFLAPAALPQQLSNFDRERTETMLKNISEDVQKHYYDPSFHGMNWEAIVEATKQKIETSDSLNMALAHIAQALVSLNDSHTFFVPPPRPYVFDYGFRYQMVGERCFVTRVRPGSDAESKGLKPGDELLAVDGFPLNRQDLWEIQYRFNLLRPEGGLRLTLRDLRGQEGRLDVSAKYRATQRVVDLTGEGIWNFIREGESEERRDEARVVKVGDDLCIIKIPAFFFDEGTVRTMVKDARKRGALILDLRGNPGGDVEALKYLVSGMFDKKIQIANQVERKDSKPVVARTMGSHAYSGKLVVLVDSRSASAAELFARVVQLEKRGEVVGDQSSGSVMEAKYYPYQLGTDTVLPYGASITWADLIMSDGKSLEHVGVTPDEVVLPTAADMAAGRDPALARAAAILGAKLSPEDAGKMFPYEWPKE